MMFERWDGLARVRPLARYAMGTIIGVLGWYFTAATAVPFKNSVFLGPTITMMVALLVVGGFGPAVVSGVISLAASAWFLMEPDGFAVGSIVDRVKLAVAGACVVAAAVIDWRARRERERLRHRERALSDGEWRYRMLLEQASDAILVFDPLMRVEIASARAEQVLGRAQGSLVGCSAADVFGTEAEVAGQFGTANTPADPALVELTIARPDGTRFVGEVSRRSLPDGRLQVIVRDVTLRNRRAEEVRQERDLLDRILETSANAILAFEVPSRRLLFVNHRLETITGTPREELLAKGLDAIGWEYAHPNGTPLTADQLPSARVMQAGRLILNEHVLARHAGGAWRLYTFSGAPLVTQAGDIWALVFSFEDITERTEAQRSVADSEERLRRITDAVPGTVYQYVLSPSGEQRFEFASAGVHDLLRLSPRETIEDFSRVWNAILPEDQERVARSILESARTLTRWTDEFQIQVANGDRKWVRGSSVPEPLLPDGSIRWNGLLLDITEHKRLEGDLLQIQKMESIGRLAGGIAHDFNNILTAIRGNVDLLLEDVPDGHEHFLELRDIRDAAERATALTRQLLAFSRKQALQTRDLELSALVRDMEKMLRRVIGEDVVLLTQPTESLGLVRADPGQLEQVLLNLAVNARDAMPSGGLLTIETRNVRMDLAVASAMGLPAGEYVSLVVRDTGHGMSDETKSRIFDPFFTTKPAGKGTGLGLAMVYGIVRQSGGAITVDSAPDRGATFRLFLPRVSGALERLSPIITPTSVRVTARRDASVLLVEDDAAVRTLTKRMLQDAGYAVREAADAYDALTMVGAECTGVDLVVSDVIMPGMGGRDLASELRARRPDVLILFMSGYLDIDLQKLGLDRRTRLLSKPFTRESLLRHVAQLLDAEPAGETVGGTR